MMGQRRQQDKFTEQPTVPMTAELLAALNKAARDDNVTRSEIMRRLLKEGVARRTEGVQNERQSDGVAA